MKNREAPGHLTPSPPHRAAALPRGVGPSRSPRGGTPPGAPPSPPPGPGTRGGGGRESDPRRGRPQPGRWEGTPVGPADGHQRPRRPPPTASRGGHPTSSAATRGRSTASPTAATGEHPQWRGGGRGGRDGRSSPRGRAPQRRGEGAGNRGGRTTTTTPPAGATIGRGLPPTSQGGDGPTVEGGGGVIQGGDERGRRPPLWGGTRGAARRPG